MFALSVKSFFRCDVASDWPKVEPSDNLMPNFLSKGHDFLTVGNFFRWTVSQAKEESSVEGSREPRSPVPRWRIKIYKSYTLHC